MSNKVSVQVKGNYLGVTTVEKTFEGKKKTSDVMQLMVKDSSGLSAIINFTVDTDEKKQFQAVTPMKELTVEAETNVYNNILYFKYIAVVETVPPARKPA